MRHIRKELTENSRVGSGWGAGRGEGVGGFLRIDKELREGVNRKRIRGRGFHGNGITIIGNYGKTT